VVYDVQKQSTEKLYSFPHKGNYNFISHARWYNDQIILVRNNKIVEIFDPQTHKTVTLYQHRSQVVALAMFLTNQVTPNKDAFEIEIKNEEEKLADLESKRSDTTSLVIVTIDHSEQMFVYQDNKLAKVIEIRKIPNFPSLAKNTYLFDMGYPYYLSVDAKHISFTSDVGLFIVEYA